MMRRYGMFWLVALVCLAGPAGKGGEGGEASPAAPATPPEPRPAQRALREAVDIRRWEASEGLDRLVDLPSGKGNAAAYYAQLETLYPKEQIHDREKDVKGVPYVPRVAPDSKGVEAILAGARIRESRLSPDYYPYMATGEIKQPDIAVFEVYLQALLDRAAREAEAERYAEADRCYRSGLIWGWHLTRERPTLIVFMLGLSIKLQTAEAYAYFLQRIMKLERSMAARDVVESMHALQKRVFAKVHVHLGDFRDFNCLYAAIKVAKHDQDFFWRQEAVLRLGVLRHGAPDPKTGTLGQDPGYQRLAEETLEYVAAKDPAPWIRKLALWSVAHVTPERFRTMQRVNLGGLRALARDGASR